jgi:alcohol dehydrogenase class IV
MRGFLAEVGLRPTLRSLGFDEALLDVVAQDAIDDAAINNSPRLPTVEEARAILESVLG